MSSVVPRATRKLVYERDGHACVACGTGNQLTLQHRRGRGMGGSTRPDTHSPANLIAFCLTQNLAAEDDADFAQEAVVMGWKVSRFITDLSVMPCYWHGKWVLLDGLGNVTDIDGAA